MVHWLRSIDASTGFIASPIDTILPIGKIGGIGTHADPMGVLLGSGIMGGGFKSCELRIFLS